MKISLFRALFYLSKGWFFKLPTTGCGCNCLGHLVWWVTMEQCTFKNVNNCLNANIYSYLKTSGGQSSNLYLDVVHFFNDIVN